MRAIIKVLFAAGCTATLCGCSVAIPLPSLFGDDDATGSIGGKRAARPTLPLAPLGTALATSDHPFAQDALNRALELPGEDAVAWANPKTGASGRFQPDPEAADAQPANCRSFLADIESPKGPQGLKGLACRAPDGLWQVEQAAPRV